MTEKQSKTPPQLADELARATRALTRAGFTYTEGAQEWKPPIGPSASPLLDRIDQLADALREARQHINGGAGIKYGCEFRAMFERIDAALAGKLPARPDTEWTDAASTPTAEDYRELQAQHDQVQSRLKAALDMLREMLGYVDGPKWQALIDERKAHDWLGRIEALLAGQVPDHTEHPLAMVPAGWQLVPVEPAFAMLAADGCKEHHEGQECIHHKNRRRIWKAMLSAAPKPEGAA